MMSTTGWPVIATAVLDAEAELLAQLARASRPGPVLECGSYHGFSTVVMAREGCTVYAVDSFTGDDSQGHEPDYYPAFRANLQAYGVQARVVVCAGRFEAWLPRMARTQAGKVEPAFAGAFLDGQHDLESVTRDLGLIRPLLRPGAWLACHDYGRFQVQPAIDWWCDRTGWGIAERSQTLVVLRGPDAA